ncbi:MAG: membrane protein insertase YidC [Endomicrobium sp.]|jgi:YidC/Oxa1 family membrane protein insertase|nr:membrane protein insertase YidC [Endomicrobium sp.]
MNKNTILFLAFSALTIFVWSFFIAPQKQRQQQPQVKQEQVEEKRRSSSDLQSEPISLKSADTKTLKENIKIEEEEFNIETEKYKASFSNRGAAVLSWSIKEKNGEWIDLVLPQAAPVMANFPGSNYKIVSKSNEKIVFEHVSHEGWKITKTYLLSPDSYMHNLNITLEKINEESSLPRIELEWGPGIGTDLKEMKENISVTRVIAYTAAKPGKLKKLKKEAEQAALFRWAALDNRYFLAAFIPEKSIDFDQITPSRIDKKHPYSMTLTAVAPKDSEKKEYSINFYLGPKGYAYLKTYDLGLEKAVDFGFFGFLSKIAFAVLNFFHGLTGNFGWAIIILTVILQILLMPLTLKSLKSAAAMKRVQPMIKEIQEKYKGNPQRLNAEMLNIYKTQKVNPLGGCLPMLLQLPIFWAFFQMLRNSYELRNEGWILWVKDLSAADQFMHFGAYNLNLLPLIMGLGMFFQQKMTAATSDPTQKKIMYIMPVVFTLMFWTFPSGLVLYWLTNSVISMIEQYFIIKKDEAKVKHV